MTIRYKVVGSDDRESYIAARDPQILKKRGAKRYVKTYTKGTVVRAPKGSLGIFTFKTRKHADHFITGYVGAYTILRVKPIGKGIVPKYIGDWLNLLTFTKVLQQLKTGDFGPLYSTPYGTICYSAVKVLD